MKDLGEASYVKGIERDLRIILESLILKRFSRDSTCTIALPVLPLLLRMTNSAYYIAL